jgi:hypothetical protein
MTKRAIEKAYEKRFEADMARYQLCKDYLQTMLGVVRDCGTGSVEVHEAQSNLTDAYRDLMRG